MDRIKLDYISFATPLGWLLLAQSAGAIALVAFLGADRPSHDTALSAVLGVYPEALPSPAEDADFLESTSAHIRGYLKDRLPLPQIPLDLRKGSGFDRAVWSQIETIPFAKRRSYGQIASTIGKTGAARAVGGACGRNPVPILIPCHRVVGANGGLGGYSGGLDIKRALLDLENQAGPIANC